MKRSTLFVGFIVVFSMFSCSKKTYECYCQNDDNVTVEAKSDVEAISKCEVKGCTWNGESN